MESMDTIDIIAIVLALIYIAAHIVWLLRLPEPSRYEEVCEDIFRKAADLED